MKNINYFKNFSLASKNYMTIVGGAETSESGKCTVDSDGVSDCHSWTEEDDCEGNVTYRDDSVTEGGCYE